MCGPDVLMWEARKLTQYDAILMFIVPLSLLYVLVATPDDEQNAGPESAILDWYGHAV